MAVITSAGTGNWNAGGSWTGGSVPSTGDEAHIDSGHTITLTANASVGNVVIDGGTIAGGGYKITCVKTSGRLFDHSGTITGNLDVELQGTHNTTEDFVGTGNIRNLILNGSGLNVNIGRNTTIAGDLTITAGELDTDSSGNYDLTVTGEVTGAGTLTGNASAISMGYFGMSGTYNATSGTTTINSRNGSGYRMICAVGDIVHNNGTFKFDTSGGGNSSFSLNGTSDGTNGIYDLEIDTGNTVTIESYALSIHRNLTITSGTLNTNGSSNYALTVTGDVSVTGTLTGNASAISMGSLYIESGGTYTATSGTTTITGIQDAGYSSVRLNSSGTLTHSNGTFHFNDTDQQVIRGVTDNTIAFYNVTTAGNHTIQMRDCDITVANDLTIATTVTWDNEASGDLLTVTGNCDVTGTLDLSSGGNHSLGSLTINSGGTYNATSGTTTLTHIEGDDSSVDERYCLHNNGTFTHNNGKIKTARDGLQTIFCQAQTNFYDFESANGSPDNNDNVYIRQNASNYFTVFNDLTITGGKIRFYSADRGITVHGNTFVGANGYLNAADLTSDTITHHGLLTNSGTYATGSGTNNFNGGVRNLGTFTSDDTITIGGTGGILEGNLDDANVNVNLDPVYGNFNGTTSSLHSASADFDGGIWHDTTGGCVSAWIYPKSDGENDFGRIASKSNATSGDDGWQFVVREESSGAVKLGFYYAWSGATGIWSTTNTVVPLNVWSHVAVTYTPSGTGVDPVMYVNGVSVAVTEVAAPSGANNAQEDAHDLYIGNNYGAERTFDGYIMDVKIYDATTVTAAQVQAMAKKINVDKDDPDLPAVGASNTGLVGWYKFNASTTADSSGESNTLTAANMGSVVYDAFSVNVQDNSTTTDGTFTVTQGKVEGLSLTCLDFEAGDSADRVEVTHDTSGFSGVSVSAWVNFETLDDAYRGIVQCSDDQNWNDGFGLTLTEASSGQLSFWVDQVGDNASVEISTLSTSRWYHLVGTFDSTTGIQSLYIDGVLKDTNSDTWSNKAASGSKIKIGCGVAASNGNDYWFDGKIRDVRIYKDFTLTADQVASLYSGNYNVTPYLAYKLDEGSGNASGWGTANAGGASSGVINGAVFSNGTLDLDYDLVIAANGTFSAPRGTVSLVRNLQNSGTFTHNSGTFEAVSGDNTLINTTGTAAVTFHNLLCSGGSFVFIYRDTTVENELHIDSSTTFKFNCNDRAVTLTMGTTSSAGEIHQDGGGFHFGNNTSNAAKIVAADTSGLNPWFNISGYNIDWDSGGSGSDVELANGNYNGTVTTGGGGVTVKLTGDMEFDAVTVSSGDTLDLNGQRMECSGLLTNSGTMDCDGALIYCNQANIDGSTSNTSNAAIINNTAGFHDFSDGQWKWMGSNFGTGSATESGSFSNTAAKRVLMSGTLAPNDNTTVGDMVIATGATYTAGSYTSTVAGDFTTSGGLIGKSALDFNAGSSPYVDLDNNAAWQFGTNNFTLEAWFRSDTDTGLNRTIIANGDASDNGFLLYMQGGGNIKFFVNNIAVANAVGPYENDSKWHHVAAVRDGNDYLLYIDGKLIDKSTQSSQNLTHAGKASIGARDLSGSADAYWDGQIAMVRVFKGASGGARTQAEIRADMFNNSASLADSTDLMCAYDFNEGTGTSLDNIQGNTNFDGTITNATWAGAGTFTYGTSTLVMTGTSKKINVSNNMVLNALTINGTITINDISGLGRYLEPQDTFTVGGSGTLSSTDSEYLIFDNSYTGGSGQSKALVIGNSSNALANLYKIRLAATAGTLQIPTCTTPRIMNTDSGGTIQATGDLTITTELEVASGATFNANGNTINVKLLDSNTGTVNLSNSALSFLSAGQLNLNYNSTLTTGNTTITGYSSGSKTTAVLPMDGNFEVVGDVKWMKMNTDSDLTVIGAVIDCDTSLSGANIRQWHHTLDTQQLLDADEAGDDDLRLTKPALDNSHELMTG